MKPLSINNGFNKMADAKLEVRAQQILLAMDGNANFPDPVPITGVMSAAITAYSTALAEAKDGDRLKVAIKNQKRQSLVDLLHQWGEYVVFKSAGDVVKAASSGFTIGKIPAPTPPITKPENLRISNGINPGELVSKVKRVKGAITYIHQYATDAMLLQQNWQSITTSRSTCRFVNLQPGIKYNCRVAAIGVKDQLLYSDVVSRIVV